MPNSNFLVQSLIIPFKTFTQEIHQCKKLVSPFQLYAKNPNRDQNKKYEQQKTVTIAQSEREIISNRSTPRTPRPASQNSATFVVNENDPPVSVKYFKNDQNSDFGVE